MTVLDHATTTIEVSVVAANSLFRGGLAYALGRTGGLSVVHQAGALAELPPSATASLLVIDLHGSPLGDDVVAALATRDGPAVTLWPPAGPVDLAAMARGGVHALITREADTPELLTAVDAARRGAFYVSPEMLDAALGSPAPAAAGMRHNLTVREVEVLRYLTEGFTHGQISRRMGLTEATVSTYVKRIRHKLHAGNKAELTRLAIERGYV